MKRKVVAILLGCMMLSLSACSGGNEAPKTEQEAQVIADGISRTVDEVKPTAEVETVAEVESVSEDEEWNDTKAWEDLLVLSAIDTEEAKSQAKALRKEITEKTDYTFFEEKGSAEFVADCKESDKACEEFDLMLLDMGLYDDSFTIGFEGIEEQYPEEYAQLEALQKELNHQFISPKLEY